MKTIHIMKTAIVFLLLASLSPSANAADFIVSDVGIAPFSTSTQSQPQLHP
jgi:hypothetical protein